MDQGILSATLENGLQVMLKEIHTSPLISHWIWYRAGSRNEHTGITGISHWVEHMQFKGTPIFPEGFLDKEIACLGGTWNAFTFMDWTTYYETLPAEHLELALEIEADRMVNSVFNRDDVETERTVIIAERDGNENEPTFRLNEEVQAAAFRVHPYHHEIIGDLADLESISQEDLYQYYRSHYTPSNAVLAIAGDFDAAGLLPTIKRIYSAVPAGEPIPSFERNEPPQTGEKRVTVEGPGQTTYIQLAHHAPAASHPDFFPLTVLDSLLTGPSSLNLFGSGISNRTSRLYRSLVETEKAVSVYGGTTATIDPYLHSIHIIVHPQSNPEEVMEITQVEIERLQEQPPPRQELGRAVKQARALFAYGGDSISNQAFWMGFAEMFSTYDWFLRYLENLAAVTPEDVQRVAQTYLLHQKRITGFFLPAPYRPQDKGTGIVDEEWG